MIPKSLPADPARSIALGLGICSLALIAGALFFQYGLGVQPCEMCHWQRWPHIAAAILGIAAIPFFPRTQYRTIAFVVVLLILISGLIGAYQTGMQMHFLPGPSACTGHRYVLGSNMVPDVQCDVVTPDQIVFGLSLASYNAIFSLLAACVAAFLLLRRRA